MKMQSSYGAAIIPERCGEGSERRFKLASFIFLLFVFGIFSVVIGNNLQANYGGVMEPNGLHDQSTSFMGIMDLTSFDVSFMGVMDPNGQSTSFMGVMDPHGQEVSFMGVMDPHGQKVSFMGVMDPHG